LMKIELLPSVINRLDNIMHKIASLIRKHGLLIQG